MSCNKCNNNCSTCTCTCEYNCSTSSIPSSCLIHKSENGETLFTEILTGIRTTYDLTCLGGGASELPFTAIQTLANTICSTVTPIYDLTCLAGPAEGTQQQAISYLITRVCAPTSPFRSYNTTCIGGTATTSLENTVDEILTAFCSTTIPTLSTLDWSCLTDPTSTDLTVVLQAVMDQVKANKTAYNVTDYFALDNTDPCNPILNLDETKVSDFVFNNFNTNDRVLDITSFKINKGDLCAKNYLMQAFSAGPGMTISEKCFDLYTYSFVSTVIVAEWAFNSITLPTGVTYTTTPLNDVALVEDFLTNIGIPVANVNISGGNQLTITFQAYGNSTTYVPTVNITANASTTLDLNTSNASIVVGTGAANCCTIHLDTSDSVDNSCEVEIIGQNGICVTKEKTYNAIWEVLTNPLAQFDFTGITLNGTTYNPIGGNIPGEDLDDIIDFLNTIPNYTFSYVAVNPNISTQGVLYRIDIVGDITLTINSADNAIITDEAITPLHPISASTSPCETFVVKPCTSDWKEVTYNTNWSGNVQYRVIGDKVEIKSGRLRRDYLGTITTVVLLEDAFTIPELIGTTVTSFYSSEIASVLYDGNTFTGNAYPSYSYTTTLTPHKTQLLNLGTTGVFQVSFIRFINAALGSSVDAISVTDGFPGTASLEVYIPSITYYI